MGSSEVTLGRIGAEGIWSDLDPSEINHRRLTTARNAILRDGVIGSHGVLAIPPPDTNRWVGQLRGKLRDVQVDFHVAAVATGELWQLGPVVVSGGTPYPGVEFRFFLAYGNEIMGFPADGVSPIIRWKRVQHVTTAAAGTVTGTLGGNLLTGVGTNFAVDATQYISFAGGPRCYSAVFVAGATAVTIAPALPQALSGAPFSHGPRGSLGLCATVTDRGKASAAGTTITGSGTAWTTDYQDQAAVRVSDIIGAKSGATSTAVVAAVGSATSLTVDQNPSGLGSAADFEIIRPMPGRTGAIHNGRLYTAGVEWARNRLYIFPAGLEFGTETNGIDSFAVNRTQARKAKFLDIPATDADGRIVALLSTSTYLLVLRDNDVHALSGEYPANNRNLILDGDGCIDTTAAVQSRYGQIWGGSKGIYIHQAGRIKDIVADRRSAEWSRLVTSLRTPLEQFGTSADRGSVCLRVIGRHLWVSVVGSEVPLGEQVTATWVYDLEADAWVGDLPEVAAISYAWSMDEDDEYMFWGGHTGGVGNISRSRFEQSDPAVPAHPGFYVETGALSGIGHQHRLTNLLVSHESVARTANDQPRLRVYTGTRDLIEATVITGTAPETRGDPVTARIRPRTDPAVPVGGALGQVTRYVRLGFEDVSIGSVMESRIHDVKAIVRERRARA